MVTHTSPKDAYGIYEPYAGFWDTLIDAVAVGDTSSKLRVRDAIALGRLTPSQIDAYHVAVAQATASSQGVAFSSPSFHCCAIGGHI